MKTLGVGLLVGLIAETVICLMALMSGGLGPHGPVGLIAIVCMTLHLPAIQVAELFLSPDSRLMWPTVIVLTAGLFSTGTIALLTVYKAYFDRPTRGREILQELRASQHHED